MSIIVTNELTVPAERAEEVASKFTTNSVIRHYQLAANKNPNSGADEGETALANETPHRAGNARPDGGEENCS